MQSLTVLNLSLYPPLSLEIIASISPDIRVIDVRHKFDEEMRESWPKATTERYLPRPRANAPQSVMMPEQRRRELDALLGQADVVCIGFPYPLDLVSRAPRLKWVHQMTAGASNFRLGDIWGSRVVATNSRGHHMTLPIAEYVMAAVLAFAKEFPRAFRDKQKKFQERRDYRPILLQSKTLGVVGLGGIGKEVTRLARALGMRVVATRRSASVRADNVDGVDTLFPPQDLCTMLHECDFVALCAQHTTETEKMMGEAQFRAMKPSAFLVNVARGGLVDEDALVKALREGWIAGAVLDVYQDEFGSRPRDDFWELPNVILTPHNAGATDGAVSQAAEVFYENLKRFIAGEKLLNVIDWQRGY